MTESSSCVIGVDAGGTGTTAWVRPLDAQQPVGRATSGSGNPRSVGFPAALQNIASSIRSALQAAKLSDDRVAAVCLCVAGAGRAEEQQQLLEWAQQQPWGRRVTIANDAAAVLAAGSADATGVALICGTGSLAWGRDAAGHTARCGGWGYLLGDEGSAFWMASQALAIVCRMADGRSPPTPLLPQVLQAFNLSQPAELVAAVYEAPQVRTHIASLAPIVFAAADRGDTVAQQILAEGSAHLAAMIDSVAKALPLLRPTLCLTGSVIVRQTAFRHRVLQTLQTEPEAVCVIEDPVAGAAQLAANSLSE